MVIASIQIQYLLDLLISSDIYFIDFLDFAKSKRSHNMTIYYGHIMSYYVEIQFYSSILYVFFLSYGIEYTCTTMSNKNDESGNPHLVSDVESVESFTIKCDASYRQMPVVMLRKSSNLSLLRVFIMNEIGILSGAFSITIELSYDFSLFSSYGG